MRDRDCDYGISTSSEENFTQQNCTVGIHLPPGMNDKSPIDVRVSNVKIQSSYYEKITVHECITN